MKIYLLNIDYFYENIDQNEYYTEVYSSLAKAVEDGKYFLSKRCNDKSFKNYEFKVTEINLEYAEQFDVKQLNILNKEEYGKYEPTHTVNVYRKDGELLYKHLRYKDKQRKYLKVFTMYPEDFEQNAGQRFKIGDIVRIKKRNEEEYYSIEFQEYWSEDKLYIVKSQPSRNDGQKYFNNIYGLLSNYDGDECAKGLFVSRYYEKDLELYDGKLDPNSPLGFLKKIIKNEIIITEQTWSKIKNGQISLTEMVHINN